jgi:hypothetical protein
MEDIWMDIKKILCLLVIGCMLCAAIGAASAKDTDLKDGIFFDRTTNYQVTIDVKFFDLNQNELTMIEENKGHQIEDVHIGLNDKINTGAAYMTVYMKPWAVGTKSITFDKVPVQPVIFAFSGCLGSSAHVNWTFNDGQYGSFRW